MLNIFSSYNERQIRKMKSIVSKINKIDFTHFTEEDFLKQTNEFKNRYASGEKLEKLLPEAFALVKEASKRVLDKTHYDVQLIGGMVLHYGNVSEMKTGEGKTLVSTLPAYLNALTGESVHVVTVNEYLAKRDYEELSPLYNFLGITSSFIHSEMSYEDKRAAYQSSIVFGTNNEFGFDYLRDNMVSDLEKMVQRDLSFAIIDEVDSILIDESRTPLIISGPSTEDSKLLSSTDALVKLMKSGVDFEIDHESQQVYLTEAGIERTEKFFQIDNLYSPDKLQLNHLLNQSLRANAIMKKDKDYIVSKGEIHIIDEFTGRLSSGRRYSNNLHQAIEAKEKVKIKNETVTKATITYQNYFRLYKKISGMTGTAATEKEELKDVYKMETIVIPTNKPVIRVDNDDLIFPTKLEKMRAIVQRVIELHDKGQPVLIGTTTIEESEELSIHFQKSKIPHAVLNAKNHEAEAEIIAQAGQKGVVTIATNMAGRGTDIKISEEVREVGGLFVLGTGKNENRRVDNQLKGRSGRQGDPGESQFYVSLEDDLMIRFGAEKAKMMLSRLNLEEVGGLSSGLLTKIFNNAQRQLEGANYEIRKRLLKYDDILNLQRKLVYKERKKAIDAADRFSIIKEVSKKGIKNMVNSFILDENSVEEADTDRLHQQVEALLGTTFVKPGLNDMDSKEEVLSYYLKELDNRLIDLSNKLPKEILEDVSKSILISVLDQLWERHLAQLDDIRQGIHLYAYGQVDPFREYQIRAKETFDNMLIQFSYDVTTIFCGLKVN